MHLSIEKIIEEDGNIRYWIFKTENGHTEKINDISSTEFQGIGLLLAPFFGIDTKPKHWVQK